MQVTTALAILVLSELCGAIRVPIDWEQSYYGDSVVQPYQQEQSQENSAGSSVQPKQIPKEYFVYTAQKPKFAVDIAKFHGVENPESHYQAYAIKPYTGKERPVLGRRKIFDENREVFQPFQQYAQHNQALTDSSSPASADYEVFQPYKAEEPALQEIYKDPVLDKIRNDILNSQYRLQNYENEAGKSDVSKDEYLESPHQTDRKKVPQRNIPATYEIHRPQRRPVYYKIAPHFNPREQLLNQKFRHPWNQNYAKIKPAHYRPVKNHLQRLRQHHAIKFDDEHNEYPQISPPQQYSDSVDGYDIYERGKEKYSRLRNNVDESINDLVKKHRPTIYQKLELQSNGDKTESETRDDDDSEFIPVKNYAQVRKTETMTHLPKEAAFADAETLDEMINAPRLREAVKSTKAQTVYTEEGYEDAAYDHAGEQKHAEENEGHDGYLKEKEKSGGKYKIPSFSGAYQDAKGNEYRDQAIHGEKWKNSDKDQEEQKDTDDYNEDETAQSVEADIYEDVNGGRDKRQNKPENEMTDKKNEEDQSIESTVNLEENLTEKSSNDSQSDENLTEESIENTNSRTKSGQIEEENSEHEVIKRETNFKVPEINLNTTFLNAGDIVKNEKLQEKIQTNKDEFKNKYPYYFQNLKTIHKDSPLRYAENLKFIPRKTTGGTEFYDSRSNFECSEVDDSVDPVPAKLQKDGHPDDKEEEDSENNKEKEKERSEFDKIKEKPRLKGLGDKIDCFKSKYFGENPLDSPFFKEDIIANPEPVTVPNLAAYKLKFRDVITSESKLNDAYNTTGKSAEIIKPSAFTLLDELKTGQLNLQNSLVKTNKELRSSLSQENLAPTLSSPQQINIYSDILENIKHIIQKPVLQGPSILSNKKLVLQTVNDDQSKPLSNETYNSYQNRDNVTQQPQLERKKRSTPFVYEPYKIIRDGQVQESKKTTTTNNVSPLIRKLQSSQVVDKVSKSNQETEQPANQHAVSRNYKDIGKKEREKKDLKANDQKSDPSFVDVNVDQRRGEPRYEIRPANHKSQYTPVENKKAISLDDYQSKTSKTKMQTSDHTQDATETTSQRTQTRNAKFLRNRSTTPKPFFDISSFLPNHEKNQKLAASNTVTKILKAGEKSRKENVSTSASEDSEEDDYEEYEDEEDISSSTTTTTTTSKPSFRKRKSRITTTTSSPTVTEEESELPRLRLITRFRTVPSTEKSKLKENQENLRLEDDKKDNKDSSNYREKKRKITKSTLVTDTESFNNGEDDADHEDEMRKDEIDSMIGIKHNMDEYTPLYEKEIEQRRKGSDRDTSSPKDEEDDEEYEDEDEDEDVEDDDDEDIEDEDDEDDDEETSDDAVTTTMVPTKRTLVRTTEAPISTTEARSSKLQLKPIVTKKKIEIHKELPVNTSSPHRTQFKQDIKEVEIIKEMPKKFSQRRPQKNFEALQLYKDDKLAEEINKLGDVEIFKENLDLQKGPRHGGNYRSAKLVDLKKESSQPLHGGNYRKAELAELKEEATSTLQPLHGGNFKARKEDTDASQSEATRLVDLGDALPARRLHGGNLKLLGNVQKSRNSGRLAKHELSDSVETVPSRSMHGGNLKSSSNKDRRRFGTRSGKLVEFDEESEDDDSEPMHGGNFKSYETSRDDDRSFHGGNYRSAKLITVNDADKEESPDKIKDETNVRSKSAVLLNSFAQAVPILTTTPAYILDPSKRMYYYVDA